MEILEEENKRIQKEAKEKEEFLKKQVETYSNMLNNLTCPQVSNNITYIINTFPNAPPLKELDSYHHMLEAKTMSLVDVVVMYHNNKKLDKFVADFIIKSYKNNLCGLRILQD